MDSFSVGIVQRNWGTYEVLFSGDGYRVKRLMIDPASALSNQYHRHRSEAWTIVKLNSTKVQNIFLKKKRIKELF